MTPLTPIRSAEDHAAALQEIEALWGAGPGTPEGDRLEVLALLVEDYEARAFPIGLPDAVEMIEHRLESQGLARPDLDRILGGSEIAGEVLARRLGLTIEMVRRLHEELGLPAEVLIKPTVASDA